MKRVATWLTVCGVAAVVTLAVADPFDGIADGGPSSPDASQRGEARPESLEGPDVPRSGVLHGRLVYTTADGCRPAVVHLDDSELGQLGTRDRLPALGRAGWLGRVGARRP